MKSKLLPYNKTSQYNHATTTANNGTIRNNGSRYPNNRLGTISVNMKISTTVTNNKEFKDKDVCNNNTEERDCLTQNTTKKDSNNNNNNNDDEGDIGAKYQHQNLEKDLDNDQDLEKDLDHDQDLEKHLDHDLYSLDRLNIDCSTSVLDDTISGLSCTSSNEDDHSIRGYNIINNNNSEDAENENRKCLGSMTDNRTNLIVNYLPQNMSQEEMRQLFSNIGELDSCKLIRDKTTGQSLSYGFVNYQDAKDANIAIQQFNGLRLQNKVIKVSLARPSSETIKGANLYICGLPKSMSQLELEVLFSQFGTIITCRILMDNVTGNSKGVAFIRYDQRHEAETAIKKLNGHTPPNGTEPITVKLANTPFNINNSCLTSSQLAPGPPSSSSSSSSSSSYNQQMNPNENNTFSPNSSTSNGVLRGMIPNMRNMTSTNPELIPRMDMVLQSNGHPSSTGVMGSEYCPPSCLQIPNNHPMTFPAAQLICPPQMHPIATFPISYQNIQLPCVQPMPGAPVPTSVATNSLVSSSGSHPPSQQFPSMDPSHYLMESSNLCCLIIYNLSPETKEGALWQTFGPFGAVHSVSIARDPVTGKCRGFGFVTMPNYHEAILAAQHLNGNPLDSRGLQIILNSPGLKMPNTFNHYVLPSVTP